MISPTEQVRHDVQQMIDGWAATHGTVRALEAGCGSASKVRLPADATLAGIDISRVQLERNIILDRKILGDVQTYEFEEGSFDLIVCWDLLEHVERPRLAMERLMRALAPDGLFVIAVPTRWSLKGLVARVTPFSVHRAFYRLVIGDKDEGRIKQDQYPTLLRRDMEQDRLRRLALAHDLSPLLCRTYQGPVQQAMRERYPAANALIALLGWLSRVASLGRIDLTHSDAVIVLRKALAGDPDAVVTPENRQRLTRAAREPLTCPV